MPMSGLFVDLDGTLADSLPALRATYFEFLARFGIRATAAEFDSLNGPTLGKIVGQLKATHSLPGNESELFALYEDMLAREYDRVAAHAGAKSLLCIARERGWRVGVVTSAREALAKQWLTNAGLRSFVEDVVGFERAGRGKPHPDPYVTALECLGCAAAASFAVEDSRQGALAAVAAGLRTLVVRADRTVLEEWPAVEAHFRDLEGVRDYLARAA
ncbi:MAG TPA: HAD family phosphatase [Steroidobacteraceae bacterium]|jgi:HAD superfamily hydrolase (TIGR01509 family)|nr:HAD family phosphatase [Steroidobacteraceae bacterium]